MQLQRDCGGSHTLPCPHNQFLIPVALDSRESGWGICFGSNNQAIAANAFKFRLYHLPIPMNMSTDDHRQQELATLVAKACQAPPDNVRALIEKKRPRLAGLIFSGNTSLDGYTMINYILPPQGWSVQTIAKQYDLSGADRKDLEKFRGRCLRVLLDIPSFRYYYRVERGRLIQKILTTIETNVSVPAKYEEAFSITRAWFSDHLCEYDPTKTSVLGWFNFYYKMRKRDADQVRAIATSREQSFDNETSEQVTSLEDKTYQKRSDHFDTNEVSDRLQEWLHSHREELQQIFAPGQKHSLNAYIVLKEIIPIVESGNYANIGSSLSSVWQILSNQYSPSADRFRAFFNQHCKSFLFEYACEHHWISWIYQAEIGEIIQRDEVKLSHRIMRTSDDNEVSAYELLITFLEDDLITLASLAQRYELDPLELRRFWNKACFPYLEKMGKHLSSNHTKDIRVTLGCLSRVETQEWVIRNEQRLSRRTLATHPTVNAYGLIADHLYPKYKTWDQLAKQYNVPSTVLENFYQDQCLPILAQVAQFLKAKTTRHWIRENEDILQLLFWHLCPHPDISKEDINAFELLKRRIIHIHKSKDWPRILRELKLDQESYLPRQGDQKKKSRKIIDVKRLQKYSNGLKAFYRQQCLPDFFKRTEHLLHIEKAQEDVGTPL